MQNLLPKSAQFDVIDLEGPAAPDFAQRMFTRDFRKVALGQGRLSLFLSADGKIQSIFWAFIEDFGMRLFVPRVLIQNTFELIERFHFADNFKTVMKGSSVVSWEPYQSASVGEGKKMGTVYEGFWRSTKFMFSLAASTGSVSDADAEWDAHCRAHKIPIDLDGFYQQLVFKAELDELCDAGKGCYIGQEVVERVRTRDLRKT